LTLILIDSKQNLNKCEIIFYDIETEKKVSFEYNYKPYFFLSHPLDGKKLKIIEDNQIETETVEKIDLFSNEPRRMTKAYTLQIKRTSKLFEETWESEASENMGFIYDNGLVFGQHYELKNSGLIASSKISKDFQNEFQSKFSEIRTSDPYKFEALKYWFNLCLQPIPEIEPKLFGIRERINRERIYSSFMLSRLANLPISVSFNSRQVSKWIKSILMTYFRRQNILFPNSEELKKGETKTRVEGALTLMPIKGIYFNTVVVDFESLYPSCIDTYNLSYETINCGHEGCRKNVVPGLEHQVCIRRRGVYSLLIGALKDLRIHWFKPLSKNDLISIEERELAEATQQLLKLILVSAYGVTIRIHGLASPMLAESITAYGRWALQSTYDIAKKHGLRPVYGDTDSLFLANPTDEEITWLIRKTKDELKLDLAVDKRYNLCILSAKKAYFGILQDGTPDIKGVTAIKSNAPGFIRKIYEACVKELSNIRDERDFEDAKKRMIQIVQKNIKDLRRGKIKLKDLVFQTKLSLDPNEKIKSKILPQAYQSAKQLIDSGQSLRKWDVVSFVKVKPINFQGKKFTVKPVELVSGVEEINVEDYVKNLTTALNQSFQFLDIDFESLTAVEMKTLMDFLT
jgi:DNA polymerase elongation subunit (family B)